MIHRNLKYVIKKATDSMVLRYLDIYLFIIYPNPFHCLSRSLTPMTWMTCNRSHPSH